MNRRNFFALAAGAALAPVAFARERPVYFQGCEIVWDTYPADPNVVYIASTHRWWRNQDPTGYPVLTEEMLMKEMERLWRECSRDPQPDLIVGLQELLT